MASCPVQWWNEQTVGDPGTDQVTKGTTGTPGWHPEETASQLPLVSERFSRTSVGIALREGAPKTPVREEEGTQGPWRRV